MCIRDRPRSNIAVRDRRARKARSWPLRTPQGSPPIPIAGSSSPAPNAGTRLHAVARLIETHGDCRPTARDGGRGALPIGARRGLRAAEGSASAVATNADSDEAIFGVEAFASLPRVADTSHGGLWPGRSIRPSTRCCPLQYSTQGWRRPSQPHPSRFEIESSKSETNFAPSVMQCRDGCSLP